MKLAFSMLIVVPAILSAQQPSDAGFKPISLQEAVALAQQNAPQAVQARGAIQNAEGQVKTTLNQYFPTVSASAGQSQSAGDRIGQDGSIIGYPATQWSQRTGLNLSYTIFDGGKRTYDVRARKADLATAEVNQIATQYTIALNVKQQYYAILAARENEAAARNALTLANQQMTVSIARVRAGAVIISDSLRSFLAVNNAQLTLMNAQNAVRTSSATLTRLVGTPYLVTAAASDTAAFAITPIDSAVVVSLAMEGPAVRAAAATVASSQAAVKSTRTSLFPTVSTGFNYNGSGYDKLYGVGAGQLAYSRSLSLSASYPIWDGFARAENVNRARVTVANNEATLRDVRLLAQQNILTQLSTLRSAEERIRIQQLSVQAAEEDLRVLQQRYTLGSSTLLDVTTSQNALNAAQFALIQARLDYRTARAQIESIIGRDLQ